MSLRDNVVMQGVPAGLKVVQDNVRPRRVPRRPKHTFHIQQLPYELTPFMIAPVLAGETLQNALLQCRSVSTEVNNSLIGGHLEHYFFYVKLRDLSDSDDIVDVLMDINTSSTVDTSSGDVYHDVISGAPKWFEMCTDVVVSSWFRDEGDTGSHVGSTTGLPMVQWDNKNSLMESLIEDADLVSPTLVGEPYKDADEAMQKWEFMKQMQLTEMTFEDYLATFGSDVRKETENYPELVRFTKNWTYPTNTVGADGTVNTQFSWSIQERADKDRFFKEPGFLVGYTVFRPKLYMSLQTQSAVSILMDAFDWLPANMKEDPYNSLKKFSAASAFSPYLDAATPTGGELVTADDYWVDVRDLFVHGDAFTNMTRDANINAVRAEDMNTFHGKKYPDSAALQLLGTGSVNVKSDGVVSLNILGTQLDHT